MKFLKVMIKSVTRYDYFFVEEYKFRSFFCWIYIFILIKLCQGLNNFILPKHSTSTNLYYGVIKQRIKL